MCASLMPALTPTPIDDASQEAYKVLDWEALNVVVPKISNSKTT